MAGFAVAVVGFPIIDENEAYMMEKLSTLQEHSNLV
jgi:hypothetical protein